MHTNQLMQQLTDIDTYRPCSDMSKSKPKLNPVQRQQCYNITVSQLLHCYTISNERILKPHIILLPRPLRTHLISDVGLELEGMLTKLLVLVVTILCTHAIFVL